MPESAKGSTGHRAQDVNIGLTRPTSSAGGRFEAVQSLASRAIGERQMQPAFHLNGSVESPVAPAWREEADDVSPWFESR
ncbi:hypothetical protein Raf01_42140 [Rugosimonospora africana]|uniref:Uncharacterized protein n=1 Tax=Rugosimonospora africana TaxID=556532 RepID=A0A8J3QU50_9ACTN|nr:hypothetical protein Raf01_42140 [Rugosimonospora africana]